MCVVCGDISWRFTTALATAGVPDSLCPFIVGAVVSAGVVLVFGEPFAGDLNVPCCAEFERMSIFPRKIEPSAELYLNRFRKDIWKAGHL